MPQPGKRLDVLDGHPLVRLHALFYAAQDFFLFGEEGTVNGRVIYH
jgi:hypothetical protein